MSKTQRPLRISLFGPGLASWIKRDGEILCNFGEVTEINVLNMSVGNLLRAIRAVFTSDLCYFWFGSFRHFPLLLLARTLGKKIIIVAGGYDVNRLESISYGATKRIAARRFLFNLAHSVLAVSEFTRESAIENLQLSPAKVKTVYHAFAAPQVPLTPWNARPKQAAFLLSAGQDMYLVKGVDRILQICRALPDVQFKLGGRLGRGVEAILREDLPQNLELLGWLEFQGPRFNELLNQSRVICIPSRMESFAAAALDGAAMGCVPVGFAVGALPEILEGLGSVAPSETIDAFVATVKAVVSAEKTDVEKIRHLAVTRFSIEKRQRAIGEVIEQLFLG